jgi:hypothetical protein
MSELDEATLARFRAQGIIQAFHYMVPFISILIQMLKEEISNVIFAKRTFLKSICIKGFI